MKDDCRPIPSILCVEPDRESRELLQEVLADYQSVLVCSAYEGLRALNTQTFDAFVLESWLPDLSGVHVCREIRKVDPCVPVVFCTAAARDQDRARGIRAGASAYLCKPIEPARLLSQLRVLLELAERESIRAGAQIERVIQQELTARTGEVLKRSGIARQAAARAIERISRGKAFLAFVDAGGTRCHFERSWSHAFALAWQSYEEQISRSETPASLEPKSGVFE
ncbi:MAG: response regulator transcription factor, partial [Burkholderiales bacterium]